MRIDIHKEDLTIDEAIDHLRGIVASLIDQRRADWKVANFHKNYGHVVKDGEWDHLSPQGIQDAIDTIKAEWRDIPAWYERYIRCKAGCGEWVVVSDKSLALKEGATCPRCRLKMAHTKCKHCNTPHPIADMQASVTGQGWVCQGCISFNDIKKGVPTSYKLHCRECQERFPVDEMKAFGVRAATHYCEPCYKKLMTQHFTKMVPLQDYLSAKPPKSITTELQAYCYYCNVMNPINGMVRVEREGGGHYVCDECLCADCGTAWPPLDHNGIRSWHNHPDELKAICWVCWERRQRPITCARCRTLTPGHDLHGQTWYAGLWGWKGKTICQKCFHFLNVPQPTFHRKGGLAGLK